MFKSGRWRSEKNKVKVVFKLQFHAAKVPLVGDEALMISVVPADVGKPTVKSDKASVREGSCFWENPVYETVKFNQEPKSGKIQERIYYFVIGTGSSKAGIIGEASIDFSNYAEATKVSLVSLPLKNSKTQAVLNVSIQRMLESNEQRYIEESQNVKSNYKDHSLKAQLENSDVDVTNKTTSDDVPFNKTVSHITELNGIRRACSESDVTISSSDSGSGVEIPWQPLGNSGHEATTDESSSTPRENIVRPCLEEDDAVEKLKSEVAALSRQAEMSELELQTLRKQIVKESKRGQDLFKEVVCLKEERDCLKGECEKLKEKSKSSFHYDAGDSKAIIEELRQELNHAKEINANLEIQLRKTQESNNELILAVRDLDEMLEQKNREMSNTISEKLEKETGPAYDSNDDDEEQKALEEIVKEHGNAKETYLLEQQIIDMRGEIEIYKRDRDELEMQMEQLALDYEIMKQENHEMAYKLEQSQIQEQLKMQYECSSSYASAHELELQIEKLENEIKRQSKESEDAFLRVSELEEELEKQSQAFESDLEEIMSSKVEQEKRAIKAEEMLRKTRLQNAKTAEKLQEEFRKLSGQMASTFEANEKLAAKALAEANELRLQKSRLEETVKRTSEEYKSVKARLEQMQLEINDKSMQLENEKKHAEETEGLLSDEILKLKIEIIAKNKVMLEERETKETLMHELEEMRTSIAAERIELDKRIVLVRSEAEWTQKELSKITHLLDEKELIVENLQLELDSLQLKYSELKNSQSELALEKEKLKKQVALLKEDLKKKEDAIKTTLRANKTVHCGSKDVANLEERIRLLEGQIKLKETSLETSTNGFLEKEKDLQNKIKELEGRLEELNQSTIRYCENEAEKSRNEMTLLKERNKEMEEELKEIQERFSEMSLKFAEVEGERQRLVMKVRNLKNAKKKAANDSALSSV